MLYRGVADKRAARGFFIAHIGPRAGHAGRRECKLSIAIDNFVKWNRKKQMRFCTVARPFTQEVSLHCCSIAFTNTYRYSTSGGSLATQPLIGNLHTLSHPSLFASSEPDSDPAQGSAKRALAFLPTS